MLCRLVWIASVLLAFVIPSANAVPPKYRITPINVTDNDWFGAYPWGINNSGQVFGELMGDGVDGTFLFHEDTGTVAIGPQCCYVWGRGMNRFGDIAGSDEINGAFAYIDGQYRYLFPENDEEYSGEANDINNAGQVIGSAPRSEYGQWEAFLWDNGNITWLPTGDWDSLWPVAISNTGAIIGSAYLWDPCCNDSMFFYKDGALVDLGLPSNMQVSPSALTVTDIIVGSYQIDHSYPHAFRYENGQLEDLGTLGGGDDSYAHAVNNSGIVVGTYSLPEDEFGNSVSRAFIHDRVSMKDITPVGGTYSNATDITENGQVSGTFYLGDFSRRAFIYGVDGARSFDLNTLIDPTDPSKPFVVLNEAIGVNELGQIAANGGDSRNSRINGFLLTPVDSTKPVITAALTGTKGLLGWYTTPVAVSWKVTDAQAPVADKTGCDAANVSIDTKSQKLTCSAKSIGGPATKTVTIKKDATVPTATIARPAAGAVFNRNQVVTASFSCTDATSGIKSCVGTKGNGVRIDTSKKVTNATFKVTATDKAGLKKVSSVTYSVR